MAAVPFLSAAKCTGCTWKTGIVTKQTAIIMVAAQSFAAAPYLVDVLKAVWELLHV